MFRCSTHKDPAPRSNAAPASRAVASSTSHVVGPQTSHNRSREGGENIIGKKRYNPNEESSKTQEFPHKGIRLVPPKERIESPQGLKMFNRSQVAKQSIQVVNISPAYKDPALMVTPRSGIRCVQRPSTAAEPVKDALQYVAAPEQLRGEVLQIPVGVPIIEDVKHSPFTYSRLEKFTQAVRDHCHQRARGITQFYVSLCRNMIGGTTPSTPRITAPRLWELERPPEIHSLTLLRCRDQLVSLTSISVSPEELAALIWGKDEVARMKENSDLSLDDKQVSYREFSSVFSVNPECDRLASLKIV